MANHRSVGGGGASVLDTALQCVIVTKLGYELRESLQVPQELPRELLALVTQITERTNRKIDWPVLKIAVAGFGTRAHFQAL